MLTKFIRIFIKNPNLLIVLLLIIIGAKFTEDWLNRKKNFRFKSSANLVLLYIESIAIELSLFPYEHFIQAPPTLIMYTTILTAYTFIFISIIFIFGLIYYLIRDINKVSNNGTL